MVGPSSRLWSPTVSTPSSGSPAPTTWRSTPSCPATASGTCRPGTSRAPAMPRTATPGSPGVPGCVSPRPGLRSSTPPRPPRSPTRTRCRCCSSRRGCRSVTPGVATGCCTSSRTSGAPWTRSSRTATGSPAWRRSPWPSPRRSSPWVRVARGPSTWRCRSTCSRARRTSTWSARCRWPSGCQHPGPCARRPSAAPRRSDPSWSSGEGLARRLHRCAPWLNTSAPLS